MKGKDPQFSVIIPTINRAHLIATAIQSVIDQRCTDWELLVIDDGSTDGTNTVANGFVQRDERIKYFYQSHQERSVARNKGIEAAKGKYICFLDDDDYYLNHHLETFQKALHGLTNPLTILRTGFYRKKGKLLRESAHYIPSKHINAVRFAAFNFCSACTLCIPKVFLQEDQFPPQFRHWQDTHLILRLLAKHPFQQIPIYTYMYVHHTIMGSQTMYGFIDAYERIQNNIDAIIHLFTNYKVLVSPFLPQRTKEFLVAQKYLDHAHGALHYGDKRLAWYLLRKSIKFSGNLNLILPQIKFIVKATFPRFSSRSENNHKSA